MRPYPSGDRVAVILTADAIDYVSYTDEGHGWYHVKNHADFYRRVKRFLAASLGASASAAAK